MQWTALLAQEAIKDPTGTLPWLQTIVQLGSFGLIVFVVIAIVKSVPKIAEFLHKDRESLLKAFKEEIEMVRVREDARGIRDDARTDRMIMVVEKAINQLGVDVKENTVATRALVLEMQDVVRNLKSEK